MKKLAVAALVPMLMLSVSAHALEQQIDSKLCSTLNAQKSADYQPGVDANGNKVTPADLPNQAQMQMPQTLQIPLTATLTKILNINTSTGPASKLGPGTETNLGNFTVQGGKVSFNGKPLSDDQEDQLDLLCANQKPIKARK